MPEAQPLKILHVLRAPVGGLFRHVVDLAEGQAARDHRVGIVAAEGGGPPAEERLAALAPKLALGVTRIPMQRQLGLGDITAVRQVGRCIEAFRPEVVHGHGAKGGAYARLAAGRHVIRAYTPHGGSLHYGSNTPQGIVYGRAERLLMARTDLFLFESAFARAAFAEKVAQPREPVRVVHNGVSVAEFESVKPDDDATDLLSVGELRHIKGIDVLIEALALLAGQGRRLTATIVGEGPDGPALETLVRQRGLAAAVRFVGYLPARRAFALGNLMVVASRAESLPYIVLEAAAAGVPLLATQVGGIPEVFGDLAGLIPPGDPHQLAHAIVGATEQPARTAEAASRLRARVRSAFSQDAMVDGVLAAYDEAIAAKFQRSH
jgi:glycosyltransferase involved in cell wall biosynthesis